MLRVLLSSSSSSGIKDERHFITTLLKEKYKEESRDRGKEGEI